MLGLTPPPPTLLLPNSRKNMSDSVIQTHNLTRFYGTKAAVEDVSLTVPRGSVFALLGRNGSGKTTTIRMLLGIESPTRGSATILGTDCTRLTPEIRSRIGYLSEGHFVYGWMRISECAKFQSECFPHWNQKVFDAVIAHFNLDPGAKAGRISRGERAGLCMALTLAPEPELLVLDDPALGLDPVARRSLVEAMLAVTSQRDRTILLSSHYLDDVERVADHIAILDKGVLRVHSSIDEFRSRVSRWILEFAETPREIPKVNGLVYSRIIDKQIHLTIANANAETEAKLSESGAIGIKQTPLSLDQAVIDYLTERGSS